MELNSNFIALQGILVNCSKETTDFTKINYRGGNEQHILHVTTYIAKYVLDKQLNEEDLKEIILFLALNTEFKKNLPELEHYNHLTNILPKLSKCLLANIAFGLDSVQAYGHVIEEFPLENTEELLDQAIECLRYSKLKDHLKNAFVILNCVAKKLGGVELSYQTEYTIDSVAKVSTIILQNVTSISIEEVEGMKSQKIYQHMGLTLLKLFDTLMNINEKSQSLAQLISAIIGTTCSIIKCVTLDVFCSWAETSFEDQPLQTAVAGKAYEVMEHYRSHKLASELVSMLASIARKPKTIAERIREADLATMIKMVDEKNEHQQLWFRALLNCQVFGNAEVLECLQRWTNLCDEHAVTKLLNHPLHKNPTHRKLILTCISQLNSSEILKILTGHFYKENFTWQEDITNELILFFNQLSYNESEEFKKHILLLIFQNAHLFFKYLYRHAFKYPYGFDGIFRLISNLASIHNIGRDTMLEVIEENGCENFDSFKHLLNVFIECGYFTRDMIIDDVLMPRLEKFNREEAVQGMKCWLEVFKAISSVSLPLQKEMNLFEKILTLSSKFRCNSFLEFEPLHKEILDICIDYLTHKCELLMGVEGKKESFSNIGAGLVDPWLRYYIDNLICYGEGRFIDYVLPSFNLEGYKEGIDENFTRLMKVLPRCSDSEFQLVLVQMKDKCSFVVIAEALTNIVILLCDLVDRDDKNQKLLVALQFILLNYGKFLFTGGNTTEDNVLAINKICEVLKHIPIPLRPTIGLSLIHSCPDTQLSLLADDTNFISKIVAIKDKQLCQAFAQKVLASKQQD